MITNRIENLYKRIFPESCCSVSHAALSENVYFFKGYIQKPDEWANGISNNDPLSYMAEYDANTNVWREVQASLIQKPDNKYMAYSSLNMRKQTIKNLDIHKLEKRFLKLKQFIKDNLDNAAHDIAGKV